jgi:hypothetical protein
MPVEWMLAVLRDPETEELRRDRMAEIAAPYLHPRLQAASITTNNHGHYSGAVDINITQVFAVPHGGRIADDGSVVIDGQAVELSCVEPFDPTPALSDQREKPAPAEPLPVVEVDTENVMRLDQFKAKRDEPA